MGLERHSGRSSREALDMTKRILHVVSNVAHYANPSDPTGLWLSELTHAHHVFAERGKSSAS